MFQLPDYKLVGGPKRFKNGRGKPAKHYAQKFRLLSEPARKLRSVSLETWDIAVARSRTKEAVEKKIKEMQLAINPLLRAQSLPICKVLHEYIDYLRNDGNTLKHVDQVDFRISLVVKQAAFEFYSEIDNPKVKAAIRKLQKQGQFKTTSTSNKYLESLQAWTRWMYENGRWENDPLDRPSNNGKATKRKQYRRLKGDLANSRPRAILTQDEFERLLRVTRTQPMRRNLTGIKRYWLYLIASQTGLRAQELHSLTPSSFHLAGTFPYVEIANTISKRGKLNGEHDKIRIKPEFAEILQPWLKEFPDDQQLFGESRSWWYKAAPMLRMDLTAAGISDEKQTEDGLAVVDFHSFRGLMITNAMRTGKPQHIAMKVGRLSDQRLLKKYLKIDEDEVNDCIDAMPLPKI